MCLLDSSVLGANVSYIWQVNTEIMSAFKFSLDRKSLIYSKKGRLNILSVFKKLYITNTYH